MDVRKMRRRPSKKGARASKKALRLSKLAAPAGAPEAWSRLAAVAPWVALGAALAFLFDPNRGRRRRRLARKRTKRYARAVGRRVKRVARRRAADTAGVAQRAAHPQSGQAEPPDDVTLARKVETEIFRDEEVPKGHINVNAEEGVVFLRGRVSKAEQVGELEREVRAIPGVRGVENRLEPGASP
jgi:hypothetical protein